MVSTRLPVERMMKRKCPSADCRDWLGPSTPLALSVVGGGAEAAVPDMTAAVSIPITPGTRRAARRPRLPRASRLVVIQTRRIAVRPFLYPERAASCAGCGQAAVRVRCDVGQ